MIYMKAPKISCLGSAIEINLSKNSNIILDLSVTLQPTGQPFLILKFEMSFFAFVIIGFACYQS